MVSIFICPYICWLIHYFLKFTDVYKFKWKTIIKTFKLIESLIETIWFSHTSTMFNIHTDSGVHFTGVLDLRYI